MTALTLLVGGSTFAAPGPTHALNGSAPAADTAAAAGPVPGASRLVTTTPARAVDLAPGQPDRLRVGRAPAGAVRAELALETEQDAPADVNVCPARPGAPCVRTTVEPDGSSEPVVLPVSRSYTLHSPDEARISGSVTAWHVRGVPDADGGRFVPTSAPSRVVPLGRSAPAAVTLDDAPEDAVAASVVVTRSPRAARACTARSAAWCRPATARWRSTEMIVPVTDGRLRWSTRTPSALQVRIAGYVVPPAAPATDETAALPAAPPATATPAPSPVDEATSATGDAPASERETRTTKGSTGDASTSTSSGSAATEGTSSTGTSRSASRPGGRPGPDNTGVPDGHSLKRHDGDLVITTPGTVIDSMDIRGFVEVKAADVVIRNSVVRGRAVETPKGLVSVWQPEYSVTIEDSELAPIKASPYIDGLRGMNITARRLNIHNVIDSVHLTGGNVLIEDTWMHDNAHFTNDPTWDGGPSHDDNVQIQAGHGITLHHNVMTGTTNAAIMLTQGAGPVSDVVVTDNWLDGGVCTVNIAGAGAPPKGLKFANNRFGSASASSLCAIRTPARYSVTLSDNVGQDGKAAPVVRFD